ncbi:MAG: hypothetical protein ACRD1H_13020 [Vicinamibacterales bacterium]
MTPWKTLPAGLILILMLSGCGGNSRANAPTTTTGDDDSVTINASLRPLTTGRDVTAPDGRYSLRVPGEWVRFDDPIAELAFRTTTESPALAINIVREDVDPDQRLQAYAEGARRRVGTVYRNVITLTLGPVRIGELEAYRWIYTATAGERQRLLYQLFVIDRGQGFVLTGMAPIDADLPTTQSLFDSIAGSLTFARG